MTKADFITLLEELIEAESNTLKGDELLEEVEGWDSLAIVNLIALVDEDFGIILPAKEIQERETINDLFDLFNKSVQG